MKKLTFCILVWLFASSPVFAQRSEIGGFVGGSFYLGDLNPTGLFSQTQFAAGIVYRYNLTTRWTLRGNMLFGTIESDDAKRDNPRNLSFRSRISEFSVQAEINFLNYFTGSRRYRFTPYIFGGVGVFAFNPQAEYYDPVALKSRWVDLAPLRTEGQGLIEYPDVKPYMTTQITFPFGLGFRYSLNRTFSIGAEWGMRKTLTDYLDDVSGFYADPVVLARHNVLSADMADRRLEPRDPENPAGRRRGSSNKADWYSFAGITLTAKIGRIGTESCPAHRKSAANRVRRQMGDS
jgi:hypothetical protein